MNYKKIIPYKLRRALSMATIAGATLVPASCSKVETEEPHDIEIEFDVCNLDEKFNMRFLQELVQDKTIRYIYLSARGHWNTWDAKNISALRQNGLQPRMEMSSKMRGRGNFDFMPGEASKVPTDSLWFVKNGWTINQR